MQALGPYHMFTPIHLAWLYYRDERGENVTAADLDVIKNHHPEAVTQPLFISYAKRAAAGKLHRKRGRKPASSRMGLLWCASVWIDEEQEQIWAERRAGVRSLERSDESPIHEAAESVARLLRLGAGRSLLNQLSRLRMRPNSRERKSA